MNLATGDARVEFDPEMVLARCVLSGDFSLVLFLSRYFAVDAIACRCSHDSPLGFGWQRLGWVSNNVVGLRNTGGSARHFAHHSRTGLRSRRPGKGSVAACTSAILVIVTHFRLATLLQPCWGKLRSAQRPMWFSVRAGPEDFSRPDHATARRNQAGMAVWICC